MTVKLAYKSRVHNNIIIVIYTHTFRILTHFLLRIFKSHNGKAVFRLFILRDATNLQLGASRSCSIVGIWYTSKNSIVRVHF